jgi:hypothetical protein
MSDIAPFTADSVCGVGSGPVTQFSWDTNSERTSTDTRYRVYHTSFQDSRVTRSG